MLTLVLSINGQSFQVTQEGAQALGEVLHEIQQNPAAAASRSGHFGSVSAWAAHSGNPQGATGKGAGPVILRDKRKDMTDC